MDGRSANSRPNYTTSYDGDVDDATFLRYSGGNTSGVDQHLRLLQEKREIETRTLASTQRSLQLLSDSEQVGCATAEELSRQREQLENTEQKLDEINASLRISERHIQSIKSVFGSIKNYFSGGKDVPPKTLASGNKTSENGAAGGGDIPRSKSGLAEVLENSRKNEQQTFQSDPTTPYANDSRNSNYSMQQQESRMKGSASVDEMLDKNLEDMSTVLGRLKHLGRDLGTELDSQNDLVERVTNKTEDVDFKMQKQSKDMNKILKK